MTGAEEGEAPFRALARLTARTLSQSPPKGSGRREPTPVPLGRAPVRSQRAPVEESAYCSVWSHPRGGDDVLGEPVELFDVGAQRVGRAWTVPSPVELTSGRRGPSGAADRTKPLGYTAAGRMGLEGG